MRRHCSPRAPPSWSGLHITCDARCCHIRGGREISLGVQRAITKYIDLHGLVLLNRLLIKFLNLLNLHVFLEVVTKDWPDHSICFSIQPCLNSRRWISSRFPQFPPHAMHPPRVDKSYHLPIPQKTQGQQCCCYPRPEREDIPTLANWAHHEVHCSSLGLNPIDSWWIVWT